MDNANAPAVLPYAQPVVSPIVIVWCRLFAFGLVAVGLERRVMLVGFMVQHMATTWDYLVGDALAVILWPLMAWYCWSHAPQLALRLSNGLSVEQARPLHATEMLSIVLYAIGLYQISEAMGEADAETEVASIGALGWNDASK